MTEDGERSISSASASVSIDSSSNTSSDEELDEILAIFQRVGVKHGIITEDGKPGHLVSGHGDARGEAVPPSMGR